jgi:hypothetical protein
MTYISNTDDQRREMLDVIGRSMDDLFAVISPNSGPSPSTSPTEVPSSR